MTKTKTAYWRSLKSPAWSWE